MWTYGGKQELGECGPFVCVCTVLIRVCMYSVNSCVYQYSVNSCTVLIRMLLYLLVVLYLRESACLLPGT